MRMKIVILAAGGVVIGLFAAGIISKDWVLGWGRHYYYRGKDKVDRGTQSINQSVGIKPSGPINPEAARICRENLRHIENAKRKYAQDHGYAIGRLTWENIRTEMPTIPSCPMGGEYILGDEGIMPKCTKGSCGTLASEDDHIVINW